MDLDLRSLWRVARPWWWLLVLAPIVSGGAAYFVSAQQQPMYRATATILVQQGANTGSANYDAILASQQLADTYRVLIVTSPVLERVIARLGLPDDVVGLRDHVSAKTVQTSQLVDVSVVGDDPQQVALIANTTVTEFGDYVAELEVGKMTRTSTGVAEQLATVQADLAAVNQRITVLDTAATPAADTPAERDSLDQQRSQLEQELSALRLSAQSLSLGAAAAQTYVSIAEPAEVPKSPFSPRTWVFTALGVFAGLLVAIGIVALLEYLDNSVKASTDLVHLAGAPLLAAVPEVAKLQAGAKQVFVLTQPQSPAAEAVRLLRTNLEFASAVRTITTLAITSAGSGEGKSTITANIGTVMAQAGLVTVIIDADLRRPTQHRIFGVRNDTGLSTLLTHDDIPWEDVAHPTAVPGLDLVPSGPIPPNPADLFTTNRWPQLLERIAEVADVILIDTSPVLSVSDPLIVATKADAVLLICRAGHTRVDALRRAAHSLHQVGVRLAGVVVNQQSGRGEEDYYYSAYYGPDEPNDVNARSRFTRASAGAEPDS